MRIVSCWCAASIIAGSALGADVSLRVEPAMQTAAPGDVLTFRIVATVSGASPFPPLRGYQITMPCAASGGDCGSIDHFAIPEMTHCTMGDMDPGCEFDGVFVPCSCSFCFPGSPGQCPPPDVCVDDGLGGGCCMGGGTCVRPSPEVDTTDTEFIFRAPPTGLISNIAKDDGDCSGTGASPRLANGLNAGQMKVLGPAGFRGYAAEFVYRVSDDARGDFVIAIEGISNPPMGDDGTRFTGPGSPGPLIPLAPFSAMVHIDGTCGPGACVSDDECSFCNGETCNVATGMCIDGPDPVCDDTECTTGSCNEATNRCDQTPLPNGSACGSPANTDCDNPDTCQAGVCATNNEVNGTACTADTNSCTSDVCAAGVCTHPNLPNGTGCDDGLFCSNPDTCTNGTCGGPARTCADTVACTTDTCNETTNMCVNTPNNAACPDDGLFCTAPPVCNPTTGCVHGGNPCTTPPNTLCNEDMNICQPPGGCTSPGDCPDDGNVCTTNTCTSGVCGTMNVSNGATCGSQGDTECDNPDTCQNGVCAPNNEPNETPCTADTNQCTRDVCAAGVCTHPNAANGTACNDDLFCTNPDTCTNGTCGGPARNCADTVACTTDTCNETTNACVNTPNNAACPDDGLHCTGTPVCNPTTGCGQTGNPCTTPPNTFCNETTNMCEMPPDVCTGPDDCPDDGDVCTTNTCIAGVCGTTNNRLPCDDGLFCNGVDVCMLGVCFHPGDPCRAPTPFCDEAANMCHECVSDPDCDDNNVCTTDTCASNVCVSEPIPDCLPPVNNVSSISQKGSLVSWAKVELRWIFVPTGKGSGTYVNIQDTFLDLSNDYPEDVYVQLYFINGDPPTRAVVAGTPPELIERAHPGWNKVDCQILLTGHQPTYWSALTGLPLGCQPFTVLDPGDPPGRPDPDAFFPGTRMLRGYVLAWAIDAAGNEIRWNHLKGDAVVVDYLRTAAYEYNADSFRALSADHGLPTDDVPGQLSLDGIEYDNAPDKLLLDFYAVSSVALSNRDPVRFVLADTSLTLHPISADLRQDTNGPITTKVILDVWNEMEARFSGQTRCFTCWDQTLLRNYPDPNYFLRGNLHTDKGKARLDGEFSTVCPESEDAALLGIAVKHLFFFSGANLIGFDDAAMSLVGQGKENATILYDLVTPPEELRDPGGVVPVPSEVKEDRGFRR